MNKDIILLRGVDFWHAHEYQIGPNGVLLHRLAYEDGSSPGHWEVANKSPLISVLRPQAHPHVEEWFRARGITFEGLIEAQDKARNTRRRR